ncbi:MAG TPA: shikimate dehydrogenase [Gaiellaceae bacterium]|nr:shikimate dehydrogenase [Gaiellaceae bacterium]
MTALRGTTTLVGLLRHPLRDSLSPPMQNAAFASAGLDWAYVALGVEPERLEDAVTGLVALGFAGANVTIPHKTPVLAYCDELDEVAERAGSVNTLVVRDGRVQGSSTDGQAVTGAVEAEGARVLVLGAGGAAQAVATALMDAGCASLRVAARTSERAHALALRLRNLAPGRAVEADPGWPPPAGDADLALNATPVLDDPLVELGGVRQVVDLAYRPGGGDTALVAAARAAGCERIVDGLDVLVAQGALSFERWTGLPAPKEVMSTAVRNLPA